MRKAIAERLLLCTYPRRNHKTPNMLFLSSQVAVNFLLTLNFVCTGVGIIRHAFDAVPLVTPEISVVGL